MKNIPRRLAAIILFLILIAFNQPGAAQTAMGKSPFDRMLDSLFNPASNSNGLANANAIVNAINLRATLPVTNIIGGSGGIPLLAGFGTTVTGTTTNTVAVDTNVVTTKIAATNIATSAAAAATASLIPNYGTAIVSNNWNVVADSGGLQLNAGTNLASASVLSGSFLVDGPLYLNYGITGDGSGLTGLNLAANGIASTSYAAGISNLTVTAQSAANAAQATANYASNNPVADARLSTNVVVGPNASIANLNIGYSLAAYAVGDGDVMTNIAITSGSKTLTIIGGSQKYGRQFTTNDIGKPILVYGAGYVTQGTTNSLSSYITNFISATSVGISNAALNTANSVSISASHIAVWGTDDTTNVQRWLDYTTNFFVVGNTNNAILDMPDKIYIIAGPIIDPWSGTNFVLHTNSQLHLPDYPIVGDFTKAVIIQGRTVPVGHESAGGISPVSTLGGIFWTFYVATNINPYVNSLGVPAQARNVTQPAFLTSQNWSSPIFVGTGINGYTNRFNPVRLVLKNLTFRAPATPHISMLDLAGCTSAELDTVQINQGLRLDHDWLPVYTNAFALRMPPAFADNNSRIQDVEIMGFDVACEVGEHLHVPDCAFFGDNIAFMCRQGGHWVIIDNGDIEGCKTCFYNEGGSFGVKANITIEGANATSPNPRYNPATIINDWNSGFYGAVDVDDTSSTEAWDNSTNAVTSFAGGVIDQILLRRFTVISGTPLGIDSYGAKETFHNVIQVTNTAYFTNSTIHIKTLSIEPNGSINFAAASGSDGANLLNWDSSAGDLHITPGNGVIWLGYGGGIGQNFTTGSYVSYGWGRADGLHLFTNLWANTGIFSNSVSAPLVTANSGVFTNLSVKYVRAPIFDLSQAAFLPNSSMGYGIQYAAAFGNAHFCVDPTPFALSGYTNLVCDFVVFITNTVATTLNGNFSLFAVTNSVGGGNAGGYRVDQNGLTLACNTGTNVYHWPVTFAVPSYALTNMANLLVTAYNNGTTNFWLLTGSAITNRP